MQEKQSPKRDPRVLVFVDALVILAPLILYLCILLLNGDVKFLLHKAEWSFVTVFYLVEVLRDQIKRQRSEGFHEDQTEAGVVFFSLILSLGVLVLFADFRNTIELSPLPEMAFLVAKFGMFILSALLFIYYRHKKYKANINESSV